MASSPLGRVQLWLGSEQMGSACIVPPVGSGPTGLGQGCANRPARGGKRCLLLPPASPRPSGADMTMPSWGWRQQRLQLAGERLRGRCLADAKVCS